MKKIFLLFLFAALIIEPSCRKIKKSAMINADMTFSAADTALLSPSSADILRNIPDGAPVDAWLPLSTMSFATNTMQNLSSLNTSSSNILSVNLATLQLQLNSGNFNFIDSVTATFSGAYTLTPPILVARKFEVGTGVNPLWLDTAANVNLENYFMNDSIYVTLNAHFIAKPPVAATMQLQCVLHLTANPLD